MASDLCACCIPGLETIVTDEIARRLPKASVLATEPGHVRFEYPDPVSDLLVLRTIEDLLAHTADLTDLPADASALDAIEAALAACDLRPALAALSSLRPLPKNPVFRITAIREGKHEFRSPEIAARAGSGIIAQTGWRVDLTQPDVDILVHVEGERAHVGVRLSADETMRRSRVAHGPASLRPTVAHAMSLLSEASPGDVLLDPMCGAGTLLLESAPEGLQLVGSDTYVPAVAAAAANLRKFGVAALLLRADARMLPLRDGSVDRIVCNLPWGIRVGSHRYNRQLYPAFFAEARRLLHPGGRMVLLTQERRLMERCLTAYPELGLLSVTPVRLGGLSPVMYVLARG